MIIRCQNGGLLDTNHVVGWDKHTEETQDNEEKHTVIAKTVLDTTVEIFEGTQEECQIRLDEVYASLNEEGNTLRHLCKGLAERDDKLAAAIKRLAAIIK